MVWCEDKYVFAVNSIYLPRFREIFHFLLPNLLQLWTIGGQIVILQATEYFSRNRYFGNKNSISVEISPTYVLLRSYMYIYNLHLNLFSLLKKLLIKPQKKIQNFIPVILVTLKNLDINSKLI